MNDNRRLFDHISSYIKSKTRLLLTSNFPFMTYNPPNTMFNISNDLPELLLAMTTPQLHMALRCMQLLKRSHEPTQAITIPIGYEHFKDLLGRTSFSTSKKYLIDLGFLIATPNKKIFIVNINMVNKLYKPKPVDVDKLI